MDLIDQMIIQNKDWWNNNSKEFEIYRDQYNPIKTAIESTKLITSIFGPRRVGKTMIIEQIINAWVKNKKYDGNKILYFSLELMNPESDLLEIIEEFCFNFGHDITKTYFYVFFDEIQFINDWGVKLKFLWDNFKNIKFIISGSSVPELRKGRETLAGRIDDHNVPPLKFHEYLLFTKQSVGGRRQRWKDYQKYLFRQLPDLALDPNLNAKKYITDLVNKLIDVDITKNYNIKEPGVMKEIFRALCTNPGQIISFNRFASELGRSVELIINYFDYLEQALLIRKVKNWRRSDREHLLAKKYYPFYTSLLLYVDRKPDFGLIAETEVGFQINAKYFWRTKLEIDFLIPIEDTKISGVTPIWGAIEVKMENTIKNKHVRTLIKFNCENRILIVKDKVNDQLTNNNKIQIIMLADINSLQPYLH